MSAQTERDYAIAESETAREELAAAMDRIAELETNTGLNAEEVADIVARKIMGSAPVPRTRSGAARR